MYGRKVDMPYPLVNAPVSLQPGEMKDISFVIPKPEKPQAYDVRVSLHDTTTNRPVSGNVVAHYVLRGASATIQNVSLSKASYAKGRSLPYISFGHHRQTSFLDLGREVGLMYRIHR